jgi:hypothetical protein
MNKTKREIWYEAKRVSEQVHRLLATEPLTPNEREELHHHADRLWGVLLSPWLPVPWSRRLIMLGIVLLGLQQAFVGNYEALAWYILLPIFSPRIMGYAAYYYSVAQRVLGLGPPRGG